MSSYDVRIKGGTVVDGTGSPKYQGDVWIKDGKIAKIGGRPDGHSDQEIAADGCVVAPGAIDMHTHYDAQIRWDPWCTVSGWHGVTSVVLGNCGFGFAPVKPEARERSMLTMTRTEAIPFESMKAGLVPKWDWETIPEYLDSLERDALGVNVVQLMPTASLMVYVMGIEAAKSRPATPAERKEMQRLLHDGMDAGLCGFSIQRLGPNSTQGDFDGTPMVTDIMADDDIFALAEVLRERDEGFIQITQNTSGDPNEQSDLDFKRRLVEVAGRPVLDNVVPISQSNRNVQQLRLDYIAEAQAAGFPLYGQATTIRTGFVFSLDNWNMYDASPAWRKATLGTIAEKMTKMDDPEIREALRRETEVANTLFSQTQLAVGGPPRKLVVQAMVGRPDLKDKYEGRSLESIAQDEGKHYVDVMLDLSIACDLRCEFLGEGPTFNADNMAGVYLDSPYTIPGVSDGGAHTKFFSGGAFSTDLLMWLVR